MQCNTKSERNNMEKPKGEHKFTLNIFRIALQYFNFCQGDSCDQNKNNFEEILMKF